jgi:hypothetical protein
VFSAITLFAALATPVRFAAQEPDLQQLPASDYINTVLSTSPLAYFPLDSKKEGSLVNGYTLTLVGGAAIVRPGAPLEEPHNRTLSLNGKMQYAKSSLYGGVPGTGSIVVWVKLAELPSHAGHFFYVCGESEFGNDFDLQFETDNTLVFYTGAGEKTIYGPPLHSLVGKWNMVAVTYSGGPYGFRYIYWNGRLVAGTNSSIDNQSKSKQFSIGYSMVFPNRDFDGEIDDVAVWNRALTAGEIHSLWAAAQ